MHTLPLDNGSGITGHELVDIAPATTSYFAEPYSFWQHGCDENPNGVLRQYLPKGGDQTAVTDEQLQAIEDKLNGRPRKRLGVRTPKQAFEASFNLRALRN